uniref:Uncharacterized protein n=1 Tax=Archaeoglobus fulgidus TaxID=2234 RepID=A0A7J2THC3_ARCFL
MGVHRISSEAARYYALREKVLGSAITLLGEASLNLDNLEKEHFEMLGDLSAKLLPHSPGYAGKLMPVIARLFWKLAGVKEKEFAFEELSKLEMEIEEIKKKLKI